MHLNVLQCRDEEVTVTEPYLTRIRLIDCLNRKSEQVALELYLKLFPTLYRTHKRNFHPKAGKEKYMTSCFQATFWVVVVSVENYRSRKGL